MSLWLYLQNKIYRKMKKIALLAIVGMSVWACNSEGNGEANVIENDSNAIEVAEVEILNYFGEEITLDDAIAASELPAALEGKDSLNVKVEGTINACCQTKGCWMDVDLGNGESMVVKFKDYGFFVPKNSSGSTAVLEGVAKVETQTVDWLKHKAEDAGKSQEEIDAITEPEVKVSFMADGVIIKGELEPEVEEVVTEEATEEASAEE
jgi:hypothetical protein